MSVLVNLRRLVSARRRPLDGPRDCTVGAREPCGADASNRQGPSHSNPEQAPVLQEEALPRVMMDLALFSSPDTLPEALKSSLEMWLPS